MSATAVQCVKLFPDGKHGVSGGRDTLGFYWDFSRGSKLATFAGHSGSVLCCHVHQRKVVTGSMDGLIKVRSHRARARSLVRSLYMWVPLSPLLPLVVWLPGLRGGVCLVSRVSALSVPVLVWGFSHHTWVYGLVTHSCVFTCVCAPALVLRHRFRTVDQVWDLRTGAVSITLSGHASPVWCLKVSEADDFTVVSGGDDGNVKIWDLRSVFGGSRLTMTGHTDSVTTLAWDWTKVVTGSRDCSVRVWDMNVGRQLAVCSGHTANVSSVALLDTQVVSASWDGRVRCWFG